MCIFSAMAVGLATGMGYIGVAVIFLLAVGLLSLCLNTLSWGNSSVDAKELKITIPEDLDYDGIFDDLFQQYAKQADLIKVKTTNMGSLFELQYHILFKEKKKEKEFIDALRCRNGNLNITLGRIADNRDEL